MGTTENHRSALAHNPHHQSSSATPKVVAGFKQNKIKIWNHQPPDYPHRRHCPTLSCNSTRKSLSCRARHSSRTSLSNSSEGTVLPIVSCWEMAQGELMITSCRQEMTRNYVNFLKSMWWSLLYNFSKYAAKCIVFNVKTGGDTTIIIAILVGPLWRR